MDKYPAMLATVGAVEAVVGSHLRNLHLIHDLCLPHLESNAVDIISAHEIAYLVFYLNG